MAYETEVFCECGAWSNLTDLEESLLLVELLELYDTTVERQTRTIQALGTMMGASFGGGYAPGSENNTVVVYGEEDVTQLPFGLGYETTGEAT